MNDDIKIITGLDESERTYLLRWSGRLPEAQQLERIRMSRGIYFRLKNKTAATKDMLEYSALILTLHDMRHAPEILHRKHCQGDKAGLGWLHSIMVERTLAAKKNRRGRGPNYKFIRIRYELIERLRKDGLSWNDVARYLAHHNKRKISASYIRRAFQEIAADREKHYT